MHDRNRRLSGGGNRLCLYELPTTSDRCMLYAQWLVYRRTNAVAMYKRLGHVAGRELSLRPGELSAASAAGRLLPDHGRNMHG